MSGPFAHLATGSESFDDVVRDARILSALAIGLDWFAAWLDTHRNNPPSLRKRMARIIAGERRINAMGPRFSPTMGRQASVAIGLIWRAYRAAARERAACPNSSPSVPPP